MQSRKKRSSMIFSNYVFFMNLQSSGPSFDFCRDFDDIFTTIFVPFPHTISRKVLTFHVECPGYFTGKVIGQRPCRFINMFSNHFPEYGTRKVIGQRYCERKKWLIFYYVCFSITFSIYRR